LNERVLIIVGIIAQYFMNEHDFSNEREIVEELLGAGFLEQKKLSLEAQGFLIDLRMKGVLPSEVEEEIIFKACQDDEGQSSLEEIKSITILTLFASIQHDHSREIDCIFEDKLDKLYH